MMRATWLILLCGGIASADQVAPPQQSPAGSMAGAGVRRPPLKPTPPASPRPPAEVGKLGKDAAGTYKCKGVTLRGDGSSTPLQANLTIALALDGAWIESSLTETGRPNALKLVDYRTYDPTAQQWTRLQLVNTAGHVLTTSLGEKAGVWTWEGTATDRNGTMQVRDYEQRDAKQLKLWGEALLAGSWQKLYEATCERS